MPRALLPIHSLLLLKNSIPQAKNAESGNAARELEFLRRIPFSAF
jgi:hypothetical protein